MTLEGELEMKEQHCSCSAGNWQLVNWFFGFSFSNGVPYFDKRKGSGDQD